jgi:hypothetical protein
MGKSTRPRARAIQRLTAVLLRRGAPRLQMTLFLAATGLTGFLASKLFHAAGLHPMAIRYPLAVGSAYLAFLLLLSLFVSYHRSRRRRSPAGSSGDDGSDLLYNLDFESRPSNTPATTGTSGATSGKGAGGTSLDLDIGDGDGLVVVVVVLILIAIGSAICASFWVLIEAPVLLAEILVDGVLLIGLARRIDPWGAPHWASGVIRRTVVPFIAVAVCFAAVGYGLEHLVPGATTMGDALRVAME